MPQIFAIDWLGVWAGTIGAFVFGSVWYGVLGKAWMKAVGIDPAEAKMSIGLFVQTFVLLFVMAIGMALVLASAVPTGRLFGSIAFAVVIWFGLTAAPMAINHRYQGKSWELTVIDGLHWLGVLLIMAIANALL